MKRRILEKQVRPSGVALLCLCTTCALAIALLAFNVIFPAGLPNYVLPTLVAIWIAGLFASFGTRVQFERWMDEDNQSLSRKVVVFGFPLSQKTFRSVDYVYFKDTRDSDLDATVASAQLFVKHKNADTTQASNFLSMILVNISPDEAREFCKLLGETKG